MKHLITLFAAALLLTACGGEDPKVDSRLIIVGFDGEQVVIVAE